MARGSAECEGCCASSYSPRPRGWIRSGRTIVPKASYRRSRPTGPSGPAGGRAALRLGPEGVYGRRPSAAVRSVAVGTDNLAAGLAGDGPPGLLVDAVLD